MGSCNVAGSMSHLSIGGGTKVAFFFLAPMAHGRPRIGFDREADRIVVLEPMSMIVSNEGTCAFYAPRFLPIFGQYNDYGSLENIERDMNVEYIEQYFGLSIEQIMEQVTRNWCGEKKVIAKDDWRTEELQSLSGMFEHYEFYKKMVLHGKKMNAALHELGFSSDVLERMGFVKTSRKTGVPRFDQCYEHPALGDTYAFYSDGEFARFYALKTNSVIGIYNLDGLKSWLLQQGIDFSEHLRDFDGKCGYDFRFDYGAAFYQKALKDKDGVFAVRARDKKAENILARIYRLSSELYRTRVFGSTFAYLEYALCSQYKDMCVDFLCFNHMLLGSNNIYMPAANGEQCGNLEASAAVHEAALEIVKRDLT